MKVAVVGATGMVGNVMLKVLAERNFPITELIPVASEKSIGKLVSYQGKDYPVVGINWLQANEFCAWRTDRVNEFILIREGLLEHVPNPTFRTLDKTLTLRKERTSKGRWQHKRCAKNIFQY